MSNLSREKSQVRRRETNVQELCCIEARVRRNNEIPVQPALTYCLSTLPQGLKARDGYALDYFLQSAFQELPGSSWTLSWDRLILPFCRSDPAIRHAAMAIGSLQQTASRADLLDLDQDRLVLALSQYGRSSSLVRNAIENHADKKAALDVESILTASLLLFCFEILHGQDEYAMMHLRSGLKILYEHTGAPSSEAIQILHERPIELQVAARSRLQLLTQTFVRLDSDLSQLGDRETFLSPVCSKPVPVSLDSLEEAMVYVDVLQSQVCNVGGELDDLAKVRLTATYPGFESLDEDLHDVLVLAASRTVCIKDSPNLAVRMEETKQSLRDLMAALATLPSPSTGEPDPRRMLVEIHIFFVWFDASVWRDADEMQMDRFDQHFEHIMGLCEQYFATDKHYTPQDRCAKTRPSFAVGTAVGQMVCLIVEKSRNSLLRRRGIKLLSGMDMRGAFDGAFLASFYQHLVETEEILAREMLGLPDGHVFRFSEIPEAARFVEVDVAGIDPCDDLYYKAEVAKMVYVRMEEGELKADDYLFPVKRPFVVD